MLKSYRKAERLKNTESKFDFYSLLITITKEIDLPERTSQVARCLAA